MGDDTADTIKQNVTSEAEATRAEVVAEVVTTRGNYTSGLNRVIGNLTTKIDDKVGAISFPNSYDDFRDVDWRLNSLGREMRLQENQDGSNDRIIESVLTFLQF